MIKDQAGWQTAFAGLPTCLPRHFAALIRSFGDQGRSLDQTESIPLTEYFPRGLVV
jgi:hypothetical protein